MSTFTKQFVSADEYEKWLSQVGERINVLSITHPAGSSVYKPRQLWIKGASGPSEVPASSSPQRASGEITVKYQTSDPALAPAVSRSTLVLQVAFVAVVFFALFVYAILKIG
jgi:hypothetical protein